MFNKDFYPTPPEVIEMMTAGMDLYGKTILEPSAGSGNIVDFCIGAGAAVIACELDPKLRKISESKCRVIAADFLTVTSEQVSHIHAIIMNPPFSADEKHIQHAWEIAPPGCQIVALCNWQTLENRYTYGRQRLITLVQDYGIMENIGQAFTASERKTGVEVGLVKLFKPGSSEDFGDYFSMDADEEEAQENGIMSYNAVREVVQRYVHAVQLYNEVVANGIKMNDLVGSLGMKDLTFTCTQDRAQVTKEAFAKDLQKKAWKWIFNKMNMEKYATKGLREDINKFVEQQTNVPFTMRNIYKMLELVVGTQSQRMDKAMLEVFDQLTSHYHENRYNVEGWKTNSHYLVNSKFIMPYIATPSFMSGRPDVHDRQNEIVEDLQKALCFLTGKDYNNCIRFKDRVYHRFVLTKNGEVQRMRGYDNYFVPQYLKDPKVLEKIQEENPHDTYDILPTVEWGKWFDWGFFEVRLYKKGTGHFKFKDMDLWGRFNQHIARIKGFPLFEPKKNKKAA